MVSQLSKRSKRSNAPGFETTRLNKLVANDNAPEYALRPGFLSTFALATDQGSKLGLSKNKSIICYYNTYQIVQFNRLPLVISFIASSSANTGLIISLEKELVPLIEELRQVVEVA
uniref:Ragulator complex protein LAMTOR3 n=1 Tax=Esox lucius TaxID=8010 RepID=A0A3P9A461_ESOLU